MNKKQAEFVKWMPFVLDALREFKGSATLREVTNAVARLASVPDSIRFAKLSGGNLRFPNQVAWARQYLVWEGLLTSPKRGIWMLTPSGNAAKMTYEQAHKIFLKWVAIHQQRRKGLEITSSDAPGEPTVVTTEDASGETADVSMPLGYKEEILSQLQNLSPAAFERFCADLLKQLGFERVRVTGGSGDRGIDGEGYLPVGPIVTTKIAFQCKRYTGPVTPKEVQSFQGAIGAVEKGIFFTTGFFTDKAREAARSPGCKPVEVIDGERLLELLETHEFGLKPTKTFEVDYALMANYEKDEKSIKK